MFYFIFILFIYFIFQGKRISKTKWTKRNGLAGDKARGHRRMFFAWGIRTGQLIGSRKRYWIVARLSVNVVWCYAMMSRGFHESPPDPNIIRIRYYEAAKGVGGAGFGYNKFTAKLK